MTLLATVFSRASARGRRINYRASDTAGLLFARDPQAVGLAVRLSHAAAKERGRIRVRPRGGSFFPPVADN